MPSSFKLAKTTFFSQPKAFYMIFMLEIWERFAFAGLMAITALYLVRILHFAQSQSAQFLGSFAAISYSMVILGGYLGDKILGIKRSILLGLILLLLAFATLTLLHSINMIYIGLAIYVLGIGLFKPNPSNLLSLFYPKQNKLDGIYTYYYMAINVGALCGYLILPLIVNHFGYRLAFLSLGIGIVLAILSFFSFYSTIHHTDNFIGNKKLPFFKLITTLGSCIIFIGLIAYLLRHNFLVEAFLYFLFILSLIYYFNLIKNSTPIYKQKMLVALVLMLQYMIYFILYIQTISSVTFFGLHNCNLTWLGIHFDEQQFNVFNSLAIIVLSPLLSIWYKNHDQENSFITKFALGNILMGLSFFILFISTYFANANSQVNLTWILIVFIIFSIGELLVSAVGLSMIAILIPKEHKSFAYSLWFITGAVGLKLGGQIAAHFSFNGKITNPGLILASFSHLFGTLGGAITGLGFLFCLLVPMLKSQLSK